MFISVLKGIEFVVDDLVSLMIASRVPFLVRKYQKGGDFY